MQHFLVYTKYNFFNLIKTKIFWITLVIYYFLLAIFLYLFPYLTKLNYLELFTYKSVLSIINILLVIVAMSMVLFLFKQGYEDGSELVLHSKPLTRTVMIWSKIAIIFLTNGLISLIAVLITSFLFTYNSFDIYLQRAIMLGAFLGPFTTGIFWSGIVVLGCFMLKKVTIFIVIISLNGLFMIVNFVNVVSIVMQPQQAAKTGIDYSTTQFINKDNYQVSTYAIATNNNLAITNTSKINGKPLELLGYSPQNILDKTWNTAYRQTNVISQALLDPASLFASFYSVYINGWSWNNTQFLPKYKDMLSTDASFHIKFNQFDLDKYSSNWISFSAPSNQTLFLTNLMGTIPNYDFQASSFSLPTPVFLNDNYVINEFSTSNLANFYETFYNVDQIKLALQVQNKLKTVTGKNYGNNAANYYYMIFSSSLMTDYKLSINNYLNSNDFISTLNNYLFNFQYQTYQLMQDYITNPSKYPEVNSDTIAMWFAVLLQPNNINNFDANTLAKMTINPQRTKCAVWQAEENNNFFSNIENYDLTKLNGIIVNNRSLPLTLITKQNLASLNQIEILPVYDYPTLIAWWIILSALLIFVGASIMYRKDTI